MSRKMDNRFEDCFQIPPPQNISPKEAKKLVEAALKVLRTRVGNPPTVIFREIEGEIIEIYRKPEN